MRSAILLLFFFGVSRGECPVPNDLTKVKLERLVPGIQKMPSSKANGGFFLIVRKEEVSHVIGFKGDFYIRCFVKMEVDSNDLWVFEKDEKGLFRKCQIDEVDADGPQIVFGSQKKRLISSELVMLPPETITSIALIFDIQESTRDFANIYHESDYCVLISDSQEDEWMTTLNFDVVLDVGEYIPTSDAPSIHDISRSFNYFSDLVDTQSAMISRFLTFDCLNDKCYIYRAQSKVFITSVHFFKKDSQNFNGLMTIFLTQAYFKSDELIKFSRIGEEFSSMEINRAAYGSETDRKGYLESPEGSNFKQIFNQIYQGFCGELGIINELIGKVLSVIALEDTGLTLLERLEKVKLEIRDRLDKFRNRFIFGREDKSDKDSNGSNSHINFQEFENDKDESSFEIFDRLSSLDFYDEDESSLKWYYKLLIGLVISVLAAGVAMATYVIAT